MENLTNEEKRTSWAVVGGAGKEVKTSADLLMDTISSIKEITPIGVRIDTLYGSEKDDGYSIRFKLKEYDGWIFGAWVVDKISNEDLIIHIFGAPTETFDVLGGRQFTPWASSFCVSMSIERDEFCKSLCNLCVVNRFIDYLKVIKNAGIFTDWIFNKTTIITWDEWDIAHEHGIFWYSIKNYLKKIFSWKRKKKCQKPKELLLD